MKYCSNCGSKRIEFKVPDGDNRLRFVCNNCQSIHYQNPNMVVGCIALWKGKVLLAKRAIEPRKNLWNLPAGFLENGETLEEGALREVLEETKAEVQIVRPFAIYDLTKAHQVYVHFLAEMKSEYFEVTPESSEVKLFDFDEIPWDEIAFTSTSFTLKKYLEFGSGELKVHFGKWPS